jgi:hypothetical protein
MKDFIEEVQPITVIRDMTLHDMQTLVKPKLVLAQEGIIHARYDINDNSKLLNNILEYIDGGIPKPPKGVKSAGVTTAIYKSKPGHEHQGEDLRRLAFGNLLA